MSKQTLFISYCWRDGSSYADELETQLKDIFDVKRDKSQLIANDDLFGFMAEIASCDNVLIVLTENYFLSQNCMIEMSFLLQQEDWDSKSMILVVDDSLYSTEKKIEIIEYWMSEQKKINLELANTNVGKSILEEQKNYIDDICDHIEEFLKGVSRRKNPSQIAVVREIIKKSERDKKQENEAINKGEEYVKQFLEKNGGKTIKEISDSMGMNNASTYRYVAALMEKGVVEKSGPPRYAKYSLKK